MSEKMSTIEEIMKCTPENLAERQFEALLDFAVERLRTVANALKNRDWEGVQKLAFDSPAGDGYGCDNYCIDFSFQAGTEEPTDIMGVVWRLKELEKLKK